jgi:hypothetical protein
MPLPSSKILRLNISKDVKDLYILNKKRARRHQWLKPVILATQEAEIRRITIGSQPRQIVHKILSQKYPSQKGLVEWLKVKALSSNPSNTHTHKNRIIVKLCNENSVVLA